MATLEALAAARGYGDFQKVLDAPDSNEALLLATALESGGGTVQFIAAPQPKLSIRHVRLLLSKALAATTRLVIVSPGGLTPFAEREVRTALTAHQQPASRDPALEVFTRAELMFPVIRHRLVPRHEILSPAATAALLAELHCPLQHLPKIHLTDPVVRFLGLSRGTVVRIHRRLGTLEPHYLYRVVS